MRLFTLRSGALLAFGALTSRPAFAQNPSTLIQISAQGRLQYVSDSWGNTVPDFSAVCYHNCEVAIF
jgi:hypothetical protein